LAGKMKAAGKLPGDWRVPEAARANTPEQLAVRMAPLAAQLPMFPLGTDFDAQEQKLVPALQWLKRGTATTGAKLSLIATALARAVSHDQAAPLARLNPANPANFNEHLMRRLVALALDRTKK